MDFTRSFGALTALGKRPPFPSVTEIRMREEIEDALGQAEGTQPQATEDAPHKDDSAA